MKEGTGTDPVALKKALERHYVSSAPSPRLCSLTSISASQAACVDAGATPRGPMDGEALDTHYVIFSQERCVSRLRAVTEVKLV